MRTQTIRPRQAATRRLLAGNGPDTSVLHLLHRACQRAEDLFQAETTGLDITPRQFAVLEKISERQGLSQANLVEHTGIDRSTMADVVRRLVTKRFVHRRRTKSDARTYALAITPEGRAALALAKPMAGRVDRQLLAALPSNRVSEFLAHLTLMVRP